MIVGADDAAVKVVLVAEVVVLLGCSPTQGSFPDGVELDVVAAEVEWCCFCPVGVVDVVGMEFETVV